MALGGGTFITQNKILPGTYMNFVSADRAAASVSERGIAAMPVPLSWGPDHEIFTVSKEDFQKNSEKIFGYAFSAPELTELRDLFQNIRTGHFFKINHGGEKAASAYCTAKYSGVRGNQIMVTIYANEASVSGKERFDVCTYFDGKLKDEQKGVAAVTDLKSNNYVEWKASAVLSLTAGTVCTGGTDGAAVNGNYQEFLDKLENYSFNTLGAAVTDNAVKGLFANWTKRMRDEIGAKFQCVLYRYSNADHEGIISVENRLAEETEADASAQSAAAVYWLTGMQAGSAVNRSLTNATYDGELQIYAEYTQAELKQGLAAGKLQLHRVGDTVRILEDINTLVSVTDSKGIDFQNNQTMRVLDQIGNDIAVLFNDRYLGKIPNDDSGRISLWNDIVRHHQELETIRAIEAFLPEQLTVEKGEGKKTVVITDHITPVSAMAQLYMTVVVE